MAGRWQHRVLRTQRLRHPPALRAGGADQCIGGRHGGTTRDGAPRTGATGGDGAADHAASVPAWHRAAARPDLHGLHITHAGVVPGGMPDGRTRARDVAAGKWRCRGPWLHDEGPARLRDSRRGRGGVPVLGTALEGSVHHAVAAAAGCGAGGRAAGAAAASQRTRFLELLRGGGTSAPLRHSRHQSASRTLVAAHGGAGGWQPVLAGALATRGDGPARQRRLAHGHSLLPDVDRAATGAAQPEQGQVAHLCAAAVPARRGAGDHGTGAVARRRGAVA